MRKLIMWNLITLDGYFEGEKPWDLSFHQLVWGDELSDYTTVQLKSADMLIYGKNTYLGMYEYWSKEKDEKAQLMNNVKKIVCSTTLETAEWNDTTIVKDAVAGIPNLKQEGNGNMFVFGSGNLSASLMKAGLFDEYRLCVAPVFLGKGKRLFQSGLPYSQLSLLKTQTLKSGGVILWYGGKA